MYELILKTLKQKPKTLCENGCYINPSESAREMASIFDRFITWIGENCFKYENDVAGWVIIQMKGEDFELGTLEQAFEYWVNNIEKPNK